MKKILRMFLIFLTLLPPLLHAQDCNEFMPSFLVYGEEKWNGLSAAEIYQQHSRLNVNESPINNDQWMSLKSLVAPYAEHGTLIISACGGKSRNFEVADLLSGDPEKTGFYLTLSKKKFFKLVIAENSKPILRKVYQVKLIR